MATVPQSAPHELVTHYAYDEETYGTAELLNGSGYLFRKDGERQATLVSLQGRESDALRTVDLTDTQYIDDEIRGGLVGGYVAVARGRA